MIEKTKETGRIREFFAKTLRNLQIFPRVLSQRAPSAYDVLAGEIGEYQEEQAATLAPVLGGMHLIARTAAASSWTVERLEHRSQSWKPVAMRGWPDWAKPDIGPHPTQTLPVAIETWILSRLIGSNSYIIPTRTINGVALEWFVPPGSYVYPYETGDYRQPVHYTYSGVIFEQTRTDKPLRIEQILHTPTLLIGSQLIGTSAFAKAAPSFRAGIKADAHAEYVHESGGVQTSVLTTSSKWGQSEQFDAFADNVARAMRDPRRRGAPIVAPGDLRSVPLYTTAQDSQLIDARSLTWSAASAILTLPPTLAGAPNVTTWGSGTRAQMDLFRAFTLSGHLSALNDTFSRLLPMGWRFRLTPEHLQWQADPLGAARYVTRLAGSIMTQNEARTVVGLPPVDDERADELTFAAPEVEEPMMDGDGGDSDSSRDDGDENETTETKKEPDDGDSNDGNDETETEATRLKATFTGEAATIKAAQMEDDDTRMSISGTAIKFGQLGTPTNGLGEVVPMVVQASAFDGADLSDVFLLVNHDLRQMIARGMTGDVKVSVGDDEVVWSAELDPEDPDAVAMYRKVKRGTYKSCSIGARNVVMEDRKDKLTGDIVAVVTKLDLFEISVVPEGAFAGSDSRVSGAREVFTAEQIEERFVPIVEESVEAEASSETTEATAEVVEEKVSIPDYRDVLYPKVRGIV